MQPGAPKHRPRKRFGQNFLHDKNIISRIVHSIELDSTLPVVEIGPGKGALTEELLKFENHVHAIEIDRDLADGLNARFDRLENFHLYCADALKFDFADIEPHPLQVIGNLPYNVSTPLLFHLLEQLAPVKNMLFMLQEEVVDRICAEHNTASYGRLSVMVQSRCKVKKLFQVPATAFSPVPKVTSAVVLLQPSADISSGIMRPEIFERLVRQAFSQRRKTIRKALKDLLSTEEIEAQGLSGTLRPAQLSVPDFVGLANAVKGKIQGP